MNTALRFSRIKPEQQPLLLQEIRNILSEVGAHNLNIYNQEYWDWQYAQLPTKKSYVYVAWDSDRIIGYYHVPIYKCSINGKEKRIGNIQDVAVSSKYRGAGLFRKLAEFANKDLDNSDVDFIYTFPNDKSIRTFLKYNNFKQVSRVSAYFRPVNLAAIIRSKINLFGLEKIAGWFADFAINVFSKNIIIKDASIEHILGIDEEIENIFIKFGQQFKNHLIRDREYLKWRYLNSARGKHSIITLREAGKITAIVVLKEDEMLGNPSLLIMDFAFSNGKENSLLYLINQVRKQPNLTGKKFNLLFISGLAPILSSLGSIGFIKIPEKVNPRVLNLLSRSAGEMEETSILKEENWLLTLGDWDVF